MAMSKCRKFIILAIIFIPCLTRLSEATEHSKPESGNIRIIKASDIGVEEWTFDNYQIDTGDVLEISVWQVEDLQKRVVVRPDGKISFPLIGDVVAEGRSIENLSSEISERLKTYIKNPQVSVIISSFGGKKVIVLGEVANKGIIRFTQPIKMMEVLALSGGYIESAGLKSVLVIRGDINGKADVIVVNALDILKGDLRENIYIQKGDIVFIPRSFVGNVAYFIRQISPLLGAATTYYDVRKTQYFFKEHEYRKVPEDDRGFDLRRY
jgi:polysaccharide biosynthesis/export protein